MTIAFEPGFGIEQAANCIYDKLELFEAGASIGRFCGDGGDAINAGAFSLNGPVRFEFSSDSSANDNGFSVNFDIVSADPCADVDCSNREETVPAEPPREDINDDLSFYDIVNLIQLFRVQLERLTGQLVDLIRFN